MDVYLSPKAYVRFYGDNVFCWSQTSRSSKCYALKSTFGELLKKLSGREIVSISEGLNEYLIELKSIGIVCDVQADVQEEFNYQQGTPYTSFRFRPKTDEGALAVKNYFRKNPTPFSLHIDLTMKCNEKCIHCYVPAHVVSRLDVRSVCRVLSEFRKMGGLHVEFSGGECFLFDGFREVINCAQSLDLSISLMSNLIDVDESLADYIASITPSMVQVSLYSMDYVLHDQITRVKGSFQKTYNALKMLFERNVPVEISCPCMSINAAGYRDLLAFAEEHKIKVVSDCILLARYNGENDNLNVRMTMAECENVLRTIISYERSLFLVSNESDTVETTDNICESKICDIGVDSIRVNSNGDYYVCPCFQGYAVGSCFKQTLEEVWTRSPRLKYLRSLKWDKMESCLGCTDLKYCKPCLVRNYNETGNMFTPSSYFCQVTALLRRLDGNKCGC